ncbi:MAG: DUF1800 family protein [Candidatus Heimdallarchaeota archaeon]|nr:DUF1800 family protein [Candidatus Heimdallarchaeota archaeon]
MKKNQQIFPNKLSSILIASLFVFSNNSQADFTQVDDVTWDKAAVRNVINTFAYGGFATDAQITAWADMSPDLAIQEILTFSPTNDKLSPPGTDPVFDNVRNYLYDPVTGADRTLKTLQTLWGTDSAENPTPSNSTTNFNIIESDMTDLNAYSLPRTWLASINKRGLNPFRQKIGFWLTNYHMSVHLSAVGANPVLIRTLYDESMDLLGQGVDFWEILANGSASSAVAYQYGHMNSTYNNNTGIFKGNDDFAREFHQLFFGILGVNPANPDDAAYKAYYEDVTVENTALMLTGMRLEYSSNYYNTVSRGYSHDYIRFEDFISQYMLDHGYNESQSTIRNITYHHAGNLEILGFPISGITARDKINLLAAVANDNPESIRNLPVKIIAHFADDRIDPESTNNPLLTDIREAWVSTGKNLLAFLRKYATSTAFHDVERYKYLTSIDRIVTVMMKTTVDNEESYLNQMYDSYRNRMSKQGGDLFQPAHFVFGGQTSLDAANNPNVFKDAYNANVKEQYLVTKYVDNNTGWLKDWAKLIPADINGQHRAGDVSRFLWNHYIGDELANYGSQEHAYITALLANRSDFVSATTLLSEEGYTTSDLQSDPELFDLIQANENKVIDLSNSYYKYNIGMAINFITATPFMFVQEGR